MSPSDMPHELVALAERDHRAAVILARADEPQKDAAGFHLEKFPGYGRKRESLRGWRP